MAGEQALKRPVLQSQPSLSFLEATPEPREDLLSLGETEAERARLSVSSSGLVRGRAASLSSAPRVSAPTVAPG